MEWYVLMQLMRRTFIRKSRKKLSGIYRFASVYYGPKRMVNYKNVNPESMFRHRAEVNAFKRGIKKALSE